MNDDDELPIRLLLALTGAPYEEGLLGTLARPESALRVVRRCLDSVDLLAVGEASLARFAVVWTGLHRLDREVVARLTASGVTTVAVAVAQDRERLLDLGVAAVVDEPAHDAGSQELAEALVAAVRRVAALHPDEGVHARAYGGPGAAWDQPGVPSRAVGVDTPVAAAAAPATATGRLVAVCGPSGAPGRTTVALGLADEMRRCGASVIVADADTYGPALASRLGVLDEASGLVAAVRAAADGPPTPEAVAAAACTLPGGLRLLTGVTVPARWPELRPVGLAAVWRVARRLADVVVVDCGPCLEDDEELAYDTLSPRRNGAALVTVDQADLVVVVGTADAVGVQRLVRCVDDVRTRWPAHAVRVVVTQVRAAVVGRSPQRQLRILLHRYAAVGDPVLVPDDRPGHDAAVLQAGTLAACAPRSPARAPLRALAASYLADR